MAKFIKSALKIEDWINDSKKEVCFVGRSNVGKSSLINSLANQKIAKVSNTPGRTQLANFFDFGSFRLVDLPGYGYASVDKKGKLELLRIINEFLSHRINLVLVIIVCDINVLTEKDKEMLEFIKQNFKNYYVALNKSDKHNKSHFHNNKHKFSSYLEVEEERLIPISAKTKDNLNKLKEIINQNI